MPTKMSERLKITPGLQALENAFHIYLRMISDYQGDRKRRDGLLESFERVVLENPAITKEDFVSFLVNNSPTWSLNQRMRDQLPSD